MYILSSTTQIISVTDKIIQTLESFFSVSGFWFLHCSSTISWHLELTSMLNLTLSSLSKKAFFSVSFVSVLTYAKALS